MDASMAGTGDISMLRMGMVGNANMAEARIHAIACEDDPNINVVHLTCKDRFDDIQQMVSFNASVIAKCPPPKVCKELEGEGDKPQV